MATSQAPKGQQKLVLGGIGSILNPDDNRDSAYYSSKDGGSKHNSTQSQHGLHGFEHLSRADSAPLNDNTPSPISTGGTHSQPLNSPASGAMSVSSIVSPSSVTFNHQGGPYEPNTYMNNGGSRRESVDSRLGAGFASMQVGHSPYASNNQSTTSLQSNLAQQRNPGSAHPDRNSGRMSNGYHPTSQRLPNESQPRVEKTAPLITGPALGAIARAAEPTKGQAWAFPEEEVQRIPPAGQRLEEVGLRYTAPSFNYDSRRNSYADSIASSQYTTESRLPAGQRRLEDGMPVDYQPQRSRASSEYQVSTHHHSLQHRQIGDLQNGEGSSPTNSQPYSRTPELRVSHKLAERKRRMEMKDLFDTLRVTQGVERGAKASKWEILTKAIAEHERQTKLIEEQKKMLRDYKDMMDEMKRGFAGLKSEVLELQRENSHLHQELASLRSTSHMQGPPHPPSHMGPGGSQYATRSPTTLPPFQAINGPDGMNGVQFQEPRSDGYRPGARY